MKLIQFLAFSFLVFQSQACLNEFGTDSQGHRVMYRYFYLTDSQREFNTAHLKERLSSINAQNNPSFGVLSDKAVILMKLGRTPEALGILEELIKDHGNEYNIVANLGTAYELSGKLDKAMEYIKKGYEINPRSHRGSEWIHVKIIEAKIKEKRQPGWLKSNPIVTVQELRRHMGQLRYQHIEDHLAYQIRTRVPFTPAPNMVIANLLKSYGEYHEKHGTLQNSLLAYVYSMEFDGRHSNKEDMKERIVRINSKIEALGVEKFPREFKRMLKIASIDQELLIDGVNTYADNQYKLDSLSGIYTDTLNQLQAELDSLKANKEAVHTEQGGGAQQSTTSPLMPLVAGVLAFLLSGVLIYFNRKKPGNV